MHSAGNWSERNRDFQGFTHCSTNIHCNSTSRRLFGGTACFLTKDTVHQAISHGNDPSNLGRWTWSLLRGRNGIATRIISAYRPVRSFNDEALTVYSQHELYFRQLDEWRDPRQAFFEDLDQSVTQWLLAGEQIILGMDLNEDTRSPTISFWREKWTMVEPLAQLYGTPNIATCRSNLTQTPIDTVWTTAGLVVNSGGMTGFGSLDLGSADHRLLWIDLNKESMFGYYPSPPQRRPKDSIPLHDPRTIRKYNNFVRRERIRLGVPQQIIAIENNALQGNFTSTDAKNYESLLAMDLDIRKRAKSQCRRFYTGQVLYSDTIGKNRKSIHLWNMVISRRQGKRTDTRAIRRLMATTNQPRALQLSLPEAEKEKEKSITDYRTNKKRQVELRESFQLKVCERRAKKFGTSVETQEKIVQNNRKQSNAFQKISRILGTKSHNSLSAVEYSDPANPTAVSVLTHSKLEIERVCAEEGRRRFTQSASTPSQNGRLFQDLGYRATQATVDLILTGDYICEDATLDDYTRELLTHLSMPPSIAATPPITGLVSTTEHITGWKKMRSTIASSPFGPLFSDYIAGCEDIQVADIDAAMAAIPVLTGYCPKAWRKAVDVMIPKKQASTHVTKLRIIVLFHAMFNMINKTIGRLAVQKAEEHNLIPAEAYGSRPGRRANICALNKVLTYDVLRQRRLPAALCSNDAVSCYDRIVHSIASICLQRLGVSAEACHMMFGTLQDLQHYISTAYGISEEPYGGLEIPLQGIGQGNGAGPAIWLIMTIPLINMLRARGYGFRSTTVITGESYHFVCYTFVDDTDTIHSTMDPTVDHLQIIQEMQQAINTWEGGLRATGGALALQKSYWYLLSMKWNHNRQRWDYQTIANTPGQLTILGDSTTMRNRSALTRHETNHAEETLGLWIAPDGNQNAQIQSLHTKIALWSDKIRTKHLNQSLAWLSITSGISMSLKYPLTATNLSRNDCSRIMKPFLDVALPALGLPRNMPHAVIFAPKEYLGYGLFDLWLHQAVDQIQACLDYGHRLGNDITGHLLRDITETLRLELGLPDFPMSYEFKKFSGCTTSTKLHTIWEFCSTNGFTLRDGLPITDCLRENDEFLMQVFSDSGYSSKELSILNLCRRTLQIEVISDIATGDGRSLQPGTLERRTPNHHRTFRLWPLCGTPSAQGWRMWRDAIIKCLLPIHSTQLVLARPLGQWNGTPVGWTWYYSQPHNTIYRRTPDGNFARYTLQNAGHATRRPTYHSTNTYAATLPACALPTTPLGPRDTIRHTGTAPIQPRLLASQETLYGIVIQPPHDLSLIVDGIQSGTCIAVTDGSFKDKLGTSGFTILPTITSPEDEAFILTNQTPGAPEDIDAYRAELGGIYGIIRTTLDLCESFKITTGAVTVGCDCVSALQNVTCKYEPSPNRPHHDLLSAIRYLLQTSPVRWSFRHVKGHQDDQNSYHALDRWSQLNVDMDGLAKSYWQILNQNRPPPFHLQPPPGQWSIWHRTQRLPYWTLAQAQRFYYLPNINKFWNKRLDSPNALNTYDWKSSALALRRLPTPQRLWIPKWLCSTIPIGRNLSRWGMPELLPCPRCGEAESHKYHVLSCPQVEAAAIRHEHLHSFGVFLDTSSAEPDLKRGLQTLLEAALTNTLWQTPITASPLVINTFRAQSQLGHSHVLEGFLSPLWASTQQAHFELMGRRTTGIQWVSRVIRKIWQIAWDLWLHRRKIKDTVDDRTLPALHATLDSAIDQAFISHNLNPPPLDPSLARWFSRQPQELHAESLDWKARWLEMVNTAIQPD
jgi:hypothetical protein